MNLEIEEKGNKAGRFSWRTRLELQSLIGDEAGVTAIEYALLGALIAVVIASSVGLVGAQVKVMWTTVSTAVTAAI